MGNQLQRFASYAVALFLASILLAGCASGGSQVAPTGPAQQTTGRSAFDAVHAASIIYTPTNVVCSVHVDQSCKFGIDVNNDGIADYIVAEGSSGGHCGFKGFFIRGTLTVKTTQDADVVRGVKSRWAAALRHGDPIGARQQFHQHNSTMYSYIAGCEGKTQNGYWNNRSRYLGLSFPINGKAHYGWAHLSVRWPTTTMTGYAYEAIGGKSIMAGQTK
jgi:hypothetical protein